jgi:hypothetical protein
MRPARVRWVIVGAFWLVQALVTMAVWPWLFLGAAPSDGELVAAIGVVLVTIMVLQAAFVLPAGGALALRPSRFARALRCGVGGLAVGLLAGWSLYGVVTLFGQDEAMLPFLPDWVWPRSVWIGVALSPVAMVLLWRRSRGGVPVGLSLAIAGAVAAMLVGALGWGVVSALGLVAIEGSGLVFVVLIPMLLSWAVMTPLIAAFTRRLTGASRLHRMASLLFRGTMVSTAALIPLDVMVRRKTDCYCGEGTFFALTFCWAAGLITLGPAVFLLPARRKERRQMRGECLACGYDLRSTPRLGRCPECGMVREAERFSDVEGCAGCEDGKDCAGSGRVGIGSDSD